MCRCRNQPIKNNNNDDDDNNNNNDDDKSDGPNVNLEFEVEKLQTKKAGKRCRTRRPRAARRGSWTKRKPSANPRAEAEDADHRRDGCCCCCPFNERR